MESILSFLKELFGVRDLAGQSFFVRDEKVMKKTKLPVELSLVQAQVDEGPFWWDEPVHKDESAEFEAIENTVLYDELEVVLKEERLEVIELPETISAIMGIIHRHYFWYGDVVKMIEASPSLSGDFLSIVNSAAFSRGLYIYDLSHALPRLGRKKIQSILFLNASKMSVPETPLFQKVTEEIISQSQVVAKICRIMSPHFGIESNEAFLAGLLHNIGRIGLLKQIHKHYDLPDDLDVEYHQSIFNNIFPTFERKAALKIGENWRLESRVLMAIADHQNLKDLVEVDVNADGLRLTAMVNLAVYISRILGYGDSLEKSDLFGQVSAKILNFRNSKESRRLLNSLDAALIEKAVEPAEVA